MTQNDLAAAAGVCVDLIRKLEQGRRHTVSIGSLQRLARALDVDAGTLLGRPSTLPDAEPHAGAVAIRDALTAIDDLTGDGPYVEPLTVEEARRTVRYAWAGFHAANYQVLSHLLPSGIAQLRATLRAAPIADRPTINDLGAQLLEVTATTLVLLGYTDVAHLALRDGIRAAEQSANPRRADALRGRPAWVLLTQGRYDEAHRLAVAAATAVEPTTDGDQAGWTLYGTTLLTGATAVARSGDRAAATTLLDDAERIAVRTGPRSDWETAWSPDGVLMQRVDVDIVTEDYSAALTSAQTMPAGGGSLPRVSRCRHLSDVALAQLRSDEDAAALESLLTIEQLSASWLRVQAEPRQIVQELRWRAADPAGLTALAERIGLVGA